MIVPNYLTKGEKMKKIIALSAVAFLSTSIYANADVQSQIDELNAKLQKLEKLNERQNKSLSEVKMQSAKDNIKFDVDFRTAYDNIQYEDANGKEHGNGAIFSNRLWLNMGYAPTDTMIFKGQLAYHKAFGASMEQRGTGFGFDTFDWISSETLNDDKVRVREAYWLWTPKIDDYSFTASVGRRPSTNGFLANIREDDDHAKSPSGHVINMEFDGASFGVKTDLLLPGMLFKVCLGRGLSNATAWGAQAANYLAPAGMGGLMGAATKPDYSYDGSKLDTVDMAGFIFVPYNDGQYSVQTTWYRGFNVPGMVGTDVTAYYNGLTGAQLGMQPTALKMMNTGDMDGMAISMQAKGIGDGISDFLDDTTLFASFAWSKTNPNINLTRDVTMIDVTGTNPNMNMNMTAESMLGSSDSETGSSIWLGAVMPNLLGGKFGIEYNKGSKYWRPFTYGEDTLIGSKLAARGSAYEAYVTQPLIDDVFSMQVRYTYIDYDYTGSGGFFGDGGTPYDIDSNEAKGMGAIKTASDLRVYFRYRY